MFPEDLTEQKKKLMAMLVTAVTNLHKLEMILPAVKALGERHKGYGVTAVHYAPVGAALLWTLEKGLGADFTPEVKAELNILPPESTRRSEVRWESPGAAPAPRREERGTFQPRERRERRSFEPREPREPRRDEGSLEARDHQPHRTEERTEEAPKKSGTGAGRRAGVGAQPPL